MLKLSDFATMNGVTPRGARKLLQTYAKDLEGHFERKGQNGTWIDETAQEFLRSKMIKNPVILYDEEAFPLIAENRELKKQKEQLQEKLSATLEKLDDVRAQQLQLQADLTEQKMLTAGHEEAEKKAKAEADELRERAAAAEDAAAALMSEADQAKAEADQLRLKVEELEAYKALPWYKKIFSK